MKLGHPTVIIPNEHQADIGPGFLQRLLKQAGVSRDEWLGK
jgi:predicted RNA binding protein YcfA (HicA-like mRNA interferase family)